MKGWETVELREAVKVKHGFAFDGRYITNVPNRDVLVTPGNFHIGGGFKSIKYKYYTGTVPAEYILNAGDLIVTMTDLSRDSDTLGYSAIVPADVHHRFLHNQRIGLVEFINDTTYKPFLYWLLRTFDYHEFIVGNASGTVIQHTSPSRIESYCFACPPLAEQRAIASVLSSLDDKIDLLRRQNKTLEAMAEALFKQWFVVEAKGGWKRASLTDEFVIIMGQSPEGRSYNDVGAGLPMFQGNADFGFRFPSERIYTTSPTRLAEEFDTLISVRAPVGAQNMAERRCCIGRGLAAFRYKANPGFHAYTYYKLRSLHNEIAVYNDDGTVFGSISKNDFMNFNTICPPIKEVVDFDATVNSWDNKIISNCKQIRTLEKLRDTLLPKLMSGEVRVDY